MDSLKLNIVSGSPRSDSQSERVGRYMAERLESMSADVTVLSLASLRLPSWQEREEKGESGRKIWSPVSEELASADAFVFVTPEYSGMVPTELKNVFLLCDDFELAHKPALITAVSAGIGGSYPVAELRMSSYKNTKVCYTPDHIIVRNAETLSLNENMTGEHEASLRKRIDYSLRLLLVYASAFRAIRESGVIDNEQFDSGM